jgi:hypothetical protein
MRPTDNFRRQHQDLAALAQEIEGALQSAEPQQLRRLLGRFAGKLQVHAAMEEEALYPRLLSHTRSDVRDVAEKLHGELGGIYSLVGDFVVRWLESGAIEAQRELFVDDVAKVFNVLRLRLEAEERELYPLADAI